jgi:hypothetical protein
MDEPLEVETTEFAFLPCVHRNAPRGDEPDLVFISMLIRRVVSRDVRYEVIHATGTGEGSEIYLLAATALGGLLCNILRCGILLRTNGGLCSTRTRSHIG